MDKLISDDIRKEVLAKITPTQEELHVQAETITSLRDALVHHADTAGFQYSFVEPQGSTGRKQTQLRKAADIDLFIGLDPEHHSKTLELPRKERSTGIDDLMSRLVNDWFTPAIEGLEVSQVQKAYSQHPYLSLQMSGLEIDILGCFDLTPETLYETGPYTAVDRTVHHTRFVADNLDDEKREDARILKSFVRACHAYGDRCAIGRMGITGVSLELLAIESNNIDYAFNSLEHLDENPIDPKGRSLGELRKIQTFRDNHVFLIDPTDNRRNIASSFTPRSYNWVKHQIGSLRIASGDTVIDLLLESPIPANEPSKWLKEHMAAYEFESDGSVHYTILRDKLYRLAGKAQSLLSNERTGEPRFGMSLMEVYFDLKRFAIGFVVENPIISEHYIRRGPPSDMREASEEFKKKHPKAELRDGYYWSTEKREWVSSSDMIEDFLLKSPIKGLSPSKQSDASRRVLNVLEQYIFPIEPDLSHRMTRVKE